MIAGWVDELHDKIHQHDDFDQLNEDVKNVKHLTSLCYALVVVRVGSPRILYRI
ncbi:MAG: hypothetical protein RLY87_2694 [Chloroflexota bacterium]|jgi:hypothetical protein